MRVKDFVLAVSSGLLLFLAFPRINLEPLAFCAFLPLLYALKDRGISQTFQLSLLCGLIFNLMLFSWVVVVMRNYGRLPLPLALLFLFLLACYLGLYVALTFTVARFIEKKGLRMTITLPFLWVFFEYGKSCLLTGFPWENLGYSQFLSLPLIQVADITGVYGISFLIILCNAFLFSLFTSWRDQKKIPWFETVFTLILFPVVLFYGYTRIDSVQEKVEKGQVMKVKLIQPNIEQAVKWDPAYQEETLRILESLSLTDTGDTPELIIWPEAATPFYFQVKGVYATQVVNILHQAHAHGLLFGSPAFTVERSEIKYHNSAFLISSQGEVLGRYDKMYLVPFGEYVPLQKLLFFVHKMVEDIGEFSPGEQPGVLSFQGKSLGVLICYEIIFPELARRCVQKGSLFLVTITNDAWFGKTSAPYQHNSMATLRAVENRVFVVRAANTGITSLIDPTGKIISATGLFTPAAVTGKIQLITIATLYSRYGDIFVIVCAIVSILFLGGCLIKRDEG